MMSFFLCVKVEIKNLDMENADAGGLSIEIMMSNSTKQERKQNSVGIKKFVVMCKIGCKMIDPGLQAPNVGFQTT